MSDTNSPGISLGALTDADTFDGFSAHDLISGLHGVCTAIDNAVDGGDDGAALVQQLAMAAKVLSAILNNAVHS